MTTLKSMTVSNYRSIGDTPVTIPLDKDAVALLGPNNCGKTSLLRLFWELRPLFGYLQSINGNMIKMTSKEGETSQFQLRSSETIFRKNSPDDPKLVFAFQEADPDLPSKVSVTIGRNNAFYLSFAAENGFVFPPINSRGDEWTVVCSERRFNYLPFAQAFGHLTNAKFFGAFRNPNLTGGETEYDLRIGSEFVRMFSSYSSDGPSEINEKTEQLCNELGQIFGYERLVVRSNTGVSQLVYSIDGKVFRDRELGAGIQQFLHTALSAMAMQPTILLIDEPEISLHASMQAPFLNLLSKYCKQVIFTTHSIGLARCTTENILVGHKQKDGSNAFTEFNALPSLAEALGQLGHGGYNESTYKAVLLVEGVTDVKVFRALLSLKDVRTEVVIVPLGGDTMTNGKYQAELNELKGLSDIVFAIVDSEDKGNGPKKERLAFKKACDAIGIECTMTHKRAIENYFPVRLISKIQSSKWIPNDTNEPPDAWKKDKNWRIATEMVESDLAGTDIDHALTSIAQKVKALRP